MSACVLLNLSKELRENDKMQSIAKYDKFNNTSDCIYHMALKLHFLYNFALKHYFSVISKRDVRMSQHKATRLKYYLGKLNI